jgi:hypothetical protein
MPPDLVCGASLWTGNISSNHQILFRKLTGWHRDRIVFQVFHAFRFARKFSKTAEVTFDVDEEHKLIIAQNLRSKVVLDKSLEQHSSMCG